MPAVVLTVVLGVVGLVALHLWVGRNVVVPSVRGPGDQWGYLGNARYLAAAGPTWVLPHSPYFTFGYSLALVPAFRLFDDPEQLFLAVRVSNALLVASTLPLLYLFCRGVLHEGRRAALAGSFAGSLVPALLAHSSSALAENLVLPLVIATALCCLAFLSDGPTWRRLWFGPSIVLLIATHNRFVLCLAAFVAVLVVGVAAGCVPRRVAGANAALAGILLAGAIAVRQRLVDARWVEGVDTPQGPASEALEILTSWNLFASFVLEAIGQLWYIAVGTLGIGLIGVGAISMRCVEGARLRRGGRIRLGERLREASAVPRRLTLAFVLVGAVGVLAVSSYFFMRVPNGAEGFVAGRHNDSFSPVWMAAGTTWLLGERCAHRLTRVLIAALAIVVTLTSLLLLVRDSTDWTGLFSRLNVPAISFYGTTGARVIAIPAAVAAGTLITALAVEAARRTPAALVPAVCAWMAFTVSMDVGRNRSARVDEDLAAAQQLAIGRAAVVLERDDGVPPWYQYFLPDLVAIPWNARGTPPETFVFAEVGSVDLERFGARLVLVDTGIVRAFGAGYDVGLWVMPGPELDELAATGRLLPD